MKSSAIFRIRFLAVIIFLVVIFFVARLFFIQIIKHDYYVGQADRQYLKPSTNIFDRGKIFSLTKDNQQISLATLKTAYIVAINPAMLKEPEKAYTSLVAIIPLDKDEFIKKATKLNDPYEEIATKVEQDKADLITKLKIKGVLVYEQKLRFYPGGRSACHVVGIMGYKGNDYEGRYGLEKYYNEMLSRKEEMSFANFFVEIFSGLSKVLVDKQDNAEANITTTIEPSVQKFFEKQLSQVKEKWQADGVGGVIIDPKTGEIFSMAYLPDFDPGEKQKDISALINPMVQSTYEMGSIVKPLTVAAGLDSGAITEKTTYNDTGCITLNTKKICNYDLKARGVVPVQEVLNQSLNLGATFVEQKIGKEKFKKYMLAYGLNEKTGIDLPGEVSGDLRNFLNSSREVESATASFGQGIALSPIEMTRALCTLGNGGNLIEPHIVKKIEYLNKISRDVKPKIIRQVLTKETSAKISKMLTTVVDTKLAGGKAKLEHYSVAAKTGTAQMSNPNGGGYYEDRYLHSFFGYFPSYNPRFLIFMYMLYPKNVKYASETLTEPFMDTTKFLINYYQVPPDR